MVRWSQNWIFYQKNWKFFQKTSKHDKIWYIFDLKTVLLDNLTFQNSSQSSWNYAETMLKSTQTSKNIYLEKMPKVFEKSCKNFKVFGENCRNL